MMKTPEKKKDDDSLSISADLDRGDDLDENIEPEFMGDQLRRTGNKKKAAFSPSNNDGFDDSDNLEMMEEFVNE